MTNKAFIATDDPNAKLPKAIRLPQLQAMMQSGKTVMWHWKAKLAVGYDPYLVYVWHVDTVKNAIDFSFVDCENGKLPPTPPRFTLALNDLDVAHATAPSTDRSGISTGDPDENKNACVVFVMMNPEQMNASMRKAATDASQVPSLASGKWPGTARVETQLLIQRLLERLRLANVEPTELDEFRRQAESL